MERSHDLSDEERARRIAALRADLAEPGRGGVAPVLPFGLPPIDTRLPGGGLGLGSPHEVAPAEPGDEPAALGFTLALVARHLAERAGEALLVLAPGHPLPYGHGLVGLGLDPGRLLFLETAGDPEVFGALEEALRSGAFRAVAGLVAGGLPLKPGRRLQLAAEASEAGPPPLVLILRPAAADLPNGAATRWRIASCGGVRDRFGALGRPCWRARLDRCRNGRTGEWLLEWDHAAHRFDLPDGLAGHAAAAQRSRP